MYKALISAIVLLWSFASSAMAKDVYVHGYTKRNGTYVAPYVRSSPDKDKSNNYGPSQNSLERLNGQRRDNDRDGVPK